jgi:hypothetical protein
MKFGAYHRERGWVEDTGVGGVYTWDVARAKWQNTIEQWIRELVATDIVEATDFQNVAITADVLERHGWLFPRLV